MRGKVHETAAPNGYVGITPAYAGKSMESADEPVEIQGSPPPMRGKANAGHMKELQNRITPAYAGKRVFIKKFLLWA